MGEKTVVWEKNASEIYRMEFELNHKKLAVYLEAKKLCLETYQLSNHLPAEEKFGLITQIRRASTSVILNLAEGSSRHSGLERKRFYEKARGSIVELDTAIDICTSLGYLKTYDISKYEKLLTHSFTLFSKLINQLKST